MTDSEYLELIALSAVIIPNLDRREFDVEEARKRQEELFYKAAQPYVLAQEIK